MLQSVLSSCNSVRSSSCMCCACSVRLCPCCHFCVKADAHFATHCRGILLTAALTAKTSLQQESSCFCIRASVQSIGYHSKGAAAEHRSQGPADTGNKGQPLHQIPRTEAAGACSGGLYTAPCRTSTSESGALQHPRQRLCKAAAEAEHSTKLAQQYFFCLDWQQHRDSSLVLVASLQDWWQMTKAASTSALWLTRDDIV